MNKPFHYNQGVECIDVIKAALGDKYDGYLQGNAIKYLYRCKYKGNTAEDLAKCRWYLERLIEEISK